MSVKKKDRSISSQECLQLSRNLITQILNLTRPRSFTPDGTEIKPGILGEGQPLQAFGLDLLRCGKSIHAQCYEGTHIHLEDKDTLEARTGHFRKAIENCDSILRQLDFCIYQYARNDKKKNKSFAYTARLCYDVKHSLQDRLNRDKLIYQHGYVSQKTHKRGR